MMTTILLAEDHTFVREGFRRMLELQPDFKVVGEADNGRRAVAMATRLVPGITLMDIAMPYLNGLEATRQMLKTNPAARVIILSAHGDDAYIAEATAAGAAGFLLKQSSGETVCKAIREVAAGRAFFSPSVAVRLRRRKEGSGKLAAKEGGHQLSSREMEVLQLIAEGRPNKETAAELGISVKTVEKHRENLMAKLDIHDTAGLTRYAIATGVIESSVQVTII